MANLKISQLPAASALTGAELIEMVQAGANVQSTVAALGGQVSSNYGIVGGPNSQLGSIASNLTWIAGYYNASANAMYGSGNIVQSNGYGPLSLWNNAGLATTKQVFNGAGSNLANSIQMGIFNSNNVASSGAWINNLICGVAASGVPAPINRVLANGVPVAGFTLCLYFTLTNVINVMQLFFGFVGNAIGAVGGANVPSQFINSIGLGRDSGDTNLQFMINNGSGTAQKTDLGVTHTSLANQLLRLVITCDGFGNCTITLTNMESGGLQYTQSYPTATAKLPAAQASTGSSMMPLFYVNNGGQASTVSFGCKYIFMTLGLSA